MCIVTTPFLNILVSLLVRYISASNINLASSGSVTINADSSVQVLAEEAYPLDQFDLQV